MYHHKVEFIPGMKDWFSICKSITTVHHMKTKEEKLHYHINWCRKSN